METEIALFKVFGKNGLLPSKSNAQDGGGGR